MYQTLYVLQKEMFHMLNYQAHTEPVKTSTLQLRQRIYTNIKSHWLLIFQVSAKLPTI